MLHKNIFGRLIMTGSLVAGLWPAFIPAWASMPFTQPGEKKSWDFQDKTASTIDDFWRAEGGAWVVADEPGQAPNRVLRQSRVERKPAFFNSKRAYTNFEFSVRLKAESNESNSRNWQMGLIFRRKDPGRYYKLRLTAANIALVSVAPFGSDVVPGSQGASATAVSGIKPKSGEQLLVFLPTGAARDTWHSLGVSCKGETISIRLDGREVQTLNDSSIGFGNFSLFTFNTSACFDDLQLTYLRVPDLTAGLASDLSVLQPPAKPEAIIYYKLPADSDLTVQVLDSDGRMYNLLTKGRHSAGINSVVWDGQGLTGRKTAAGVYTIVLQTPKMKQRLKLRVRPQPAGKGAVKP